MNYANEWVDDVIASQISMYFVRRNDENPIFQQWISKTCLISLNKCRIMFALIYFDMGTCFYNVQNLIYKIHGKLWGDEILSSLINHIEYSRYVSLKITKITKFISSFFLLIPYTSNFHRSLRNYLLFAWIWLVFCPNMAPWKNSRGCSP